jgi:U4/U6 small nuclear ribonucleoprotein PRP31
MALVGKTSHFLRQIAPELNRVHKQCRDAFHPRFPELESIIPSAVDFARVVKVIGNESHSEKKDLAT